MPAKSYLSLVAGRNKITTATVVGGSAGNDGDIVALGTDGRLDSSVLPTGIGADTLTSTAAGALTAGDFVYVNSSGAIARASAATGGRDATGFVLVASSSGAAATIYFEGRNTALSSLTVGSRYYLSDATAGGVTATPVSGTGKIHQFLGYAVSATTIAFEGDDGVDL